MKRLTLGLILLQIGACCANSFAQGLRQTAPLIDSSRTVDLAKVAKAKVQISNDDLRMGDLVKLDVGLLLESKEPVYFPEKLQYGLFIADEKGSRIPLDVFSFVESLGEFGLYTNGYLIGKTYFLIGCNGPAITSMNSAWSAADKDDPRSLFRQGIFYPPADLCLDLPGAGKYSLRVEVYNESLRRQDKESGMVPTATGSVSSNVLQFKVEPR